MLIKLTILTNIMMNKLLIDRWLGMAYFWLDKQGVFMTYFLSTG